MDIPKFYFWQIDDTTLAEGTRMASRRRMVITL